MQEYVLIVAGGSGTRMNSPLPKQFIPLGNLPILMHTILAFDRYSSKIPIILVLPEDQIPIWRSLCLQYNFDREIIIQKGGSSRFQSVKSGLSCITEEGLVAIHDGVRPFIDVDLIGTCFSEAAKYGNATVAIPLKESVREVTDEYTSVARNRGNYRIIQTPQTFKVSVIWKAYQCTESEILTDDASVAELAGEKIHLINGNYRNIKITTQEDLIFAEAILSKLYR